jgi:hypothetical protein
VPPDHLDREAESPGHVLLGQPTPTPVLGETWLEVGSLGARHGISR